MLSTPSSVAASTLVKLAPEPWKVVAVTELIPEIFVELSPTILPLAVISLVTVSDPNVPTLVRKN